MEQNLITQKNQVQVQTGLPHLKSGKDRLELALKSSKIREAPLDEIKQVLRLTMLKLGIRANNLPTDEEKSVLLAHIIDFYGNFTCEEIILAFNLAMSNKLNISENEVNSYENFSCLYFSKIMNAYREWTVTPRRDIENEKRRLELPYDRRYNLSDIEINEWYNELVEKVRLNENYDFNFLSSELFSNLERIGTITITNEEKKVFFEKAIIVREKYLESLFLEDSSLTTTFYNFIEQKKYEHFDYGNLISIKTIAKKLALLSNIKNKINETIPL